jgi:hypothetical protein
MARVLWKMEGKNKWQDLPSRQYFDVLNDRYVK